MSIGIVSGGAVSPPVTVTTTVSEERNQSALTRNVKAKMPGGSWTVVLRLSPMAKPVWLSIHSTDVYGAPVTLPVSVTEVSAPQVPGTVWSGPAFAIGRSHPT